jgi:ABC-type multidrug transport system ATPase subunit
MDEPSSGLDPASRRALWNAVMSAKENRAIVLTSTLYTHTPTYILRDHTPFSASSLS